MPELVLIRVPDGIHFSDLRLGRDAGTGDLTLDWTILSRIITASGLDPELFLNTTEDNICALLVAWYDMARAAGEPSDPIMEDLLTEMQEEDRLGGGVSHPPGQA